MSAQETASAAPTTQETASSAARIRGDVNNQLGMLHYCLRGFCPLSDSVKESLSQDAPALNTTALSRRFPNVRIVENTLPDKFARELRTFLHKIPWNKETPLQDDVKNPPLDNMSTHSRTPHYVPNALRNVREYMNSPNSSKNKRRLRQRGQWILEHYMSGTWRATPKHWFGFAISIIPHYFDLLEMRFRASEKEFPKIGSYYKACWVLQRTIQGHMMLPHTDEFEGRRIAFILYLTPDDWSREDGGLLGVHNIDKSAGSDYIPADKDIEYIVPSFNKMILWDMTDRQSPLHWVTRVRASDNKQRWALVGFFYQAAPAVSPTTEILK